MHSPAVQASPLVHASPSVQVAVLARFVQPFAESQASVVQGLPSLQSGPAPGTHAPPAQASPTVHALPSSQAMVLLACAQPVATLQLSLVQGFVSSHWVTAPARQAPPPHTSPAVQALASVQLAELGKLVQPVAPSQPSSVHRLPSLQLPVLLTC